MVLSMSAQQTCHVNVIVLCFGLMSHLFGHPDTNIYEL